MFDQLKMVKQMAGLLGNPEQLKEKAAKVQEELEQVIVEAQAGAGAVTVRVNGKMKVLDIAFDKPMLVALVGEGDEADTAMVQELIVTATNAAMVKAQDEARQRISALAGDMNIPGIDGLLNSM